MRFLFRAKREENFFETLTISCAGGLQTRIGTGGRPASRAVGGLTISCAGEPPTTPGPEVGRRLEQMGGTRKEGGTALKILQPQHRGWGI